MAKEQRNATTAWLERSNPLRGLTIAQANMIFDCARNGDTQRLHWMYQEIETQNPVLSMATTRRAGAAANFAWRVSERAAMDGKLSAEQKDAAERFFGDIENLSDLFEHLDLALFRGFAHAQPIWEDDRTVRHIELLDSWKFLKKDGEWLFNSVCDGFSSNCVSCRDARLVTVERRRPVDVPALAIHLRAAVGSRDWGRFIERYALPKPAVVMAQNATEEDRDKYLESASSLENGQVTVWPSGASLMDFAGSSRGVDPFTAFIQHQEKTILMLATGGTLGSMAESGAGTLAGNAQADVWDQIVSRDAGIIAQAVRRAMLNPFLAAAFPGQPVAVEFGFDLTKKPTPKEIFETATAAKNAGYLVDQATLEEETGWKLEKAPESPSPVPGFAMNSQPKPETPFKNAANGLQNAPEKPDGQGDPKAEDALVEALSGLFEKSLAEAAAGEVANANPDQPRGQPDNAGQFASTGGGAAAESDKVKKKREKRERQAANKAKGVAGMKTVFNGGDCINFMESEKLGRISFYQENYVHIYKNTNGNHAIMLEGDNIPNVLAYGKYYPDTYQGKSGWAVMLGDKFVFLSKDGEGVRVDSAYVSKSKAAVFARRAAIENSEDAEPCLF